MQEMWFCSQPVYRGFTKFFRITLGYDTLENFLRTNFMMVQHHKWNMESLENMVAWERTVHVTLLRTYLREENERIRLEQQTRR